MSAPPERRSGLASTSSPPMTMSAPSSITLSRPSDRSRSPLRWSVVIESPLCAHVSGFQTRETLTEMRGRPPMWSSVSKAWVTTEAVARDLIARGERRGIQVDVESYIVVQVGRDESPVQDVTPDPDPSLW